MKGCCTILVRFAKGRALITGLASLQELRRPIRRIMDTPVLKDVKTPNAAPEYRLEEQIGFKLRLANQKHLEVFARLMPDVTPTQFAVMAKLRDEGTISQNHLGRLVGMDAATTKGVVDRLRKKGLLQSTPSQTDMRRLEISLTEEGQAFAEEAVVTAREISRQTVGNLTPREVERLLGLLDKL